MSVTMMNPTWYDLLDVEPDATTDEIRAAWKSAIEDLEPTDRRFRTLNEAAAVLLDKDKREAYDAELAAAEESETADEPDTTEAAEDTDVDEPEAVAEAAVADTDEVDEDDAEAAATDADEAEDTEADEADEADDAEAAEPGVRGGLPELPVWVLAAVGVLAAASLVAALVLYFGQEKTVTVSNDNTTTSTTEGSVGKEITKNHTLMVEEKATPALTAAKKAVVPLLSYDYKSMDASKKKAHAVMTKKYQDDYDRLFEVLVDNVPNTKTVVKTLPPVDAGVVRVGDDRVQVLVLVDRQVTNAERTQPVGYQEYATLTMAKVGDKWLVDGVTTVPGDK